MFFVKPELLVLAAASFGVHAPPSDLAITGARIELGDGKSIPSGTVLIHDGKIADVGPNLTAPTGAVTIDATGMVLYPGFIDAYSTSGLNVPTASTGERAPDARTTAPASMWHGNRKGIRSEVECCKVLELRSTGKYARAVGITTALLATGGGPVGGITTVVDFVPGPPPDPAAAKGSSKPESGNVILPDAAVELSFRNSGGGGGGFGGGYPSTLFGIVGLLRQTLADAQFYAAQDAPAKKDAAMENLRAVVTGKMPALFLADSAREIVRAQRISDEFSLKMILLGGREAYRDIDLLKAKNLSVVASMDAGYEPSMKPDSSTPSSDAEPTAVMQERHDTWAEHAANVRKLYDAGIPMALTSLGLSGGVDDFLKGLRRVIGLGVPEEAVLQSVTSSSAAILGISDKTGTIAPGKLANLVLFNGDFADPKSKVVSVFVEGQKVDMPKEGSK